MDRPVAQDPVLEDTIAYHMDARERCLREAAKHGRLGATIDESDVHTYTPEWHDYIRWGRTKLWRMERYEQACADYHHDMIEFWRDPMSEHFTRNGRPRHPQRHHYGL